MRRWLKWSIPENLFQSYWDLKIWPKWVFWGKIHHFEFTFFVITFVLVILQFGMGKFFGVWNPKITLRRLEKKKVLRFEDFTFSVLVTRPVPINTCGWIDNYKKLFSSFINKFFCEKLFQPIIEPKMAFGSLLGSSEWCHEFWALLIDCTIVYGQT